MAITIALAGNPNCGKTTLFNALTGANQYVGNWPGVTVEKKEGKLKGHKDVAITDTYSNRRNTPLYGKVHHIEHTDYESDRIYKEDRIEEQRHRPRTGVFPPA